MGVVRAELTTETISPTERFGDEACGAELVFLGVVRGRNQGRDVVSVEYDAVDGLCQATFREIAEEARDRWGEDLSISIVHRVGLLRVGETSVRIAVASPHRDEAYRASRHLIEELKTRAPIWKRETYVDGRSEWLKGHALCGHSEEAPA